MLSNDNQKIIIYGVISIVIIIIIMIIINRFVKKINKTSEQIEYTSLLTSGYFNPEYYKTAKGYVKLEDSVVKQIAVQLHEELRKIRLWFGGDRIPNPDLVLSIFGRLPNKTSISQLCETFLLMYKKDLRGYLLENLGDDNEQQLINIVKDLPKI